MKDGVLPISVIVPVRNEEKTIARCLEPLSVFSEVIVVDSHSQDRTREIAEEYGATIVNFLWNGAFPKKRNWALLNIELKNEWVLFLDADEIVTQAFLEEVVSAIENEEYCGYWLNYTNYFLGKRLRYGDPQRKLALFKRGAGLYERIEDLAWTSLDMEVHEHPILSGKVGEIRERVLHHDDKGLHRYLLRHCEYARWEANRLKAIRRETSADRPHLTARQKAKYAWVTHWWFAPAYFLYTYIIKRGFLDGSSGLSIAFYKMWYFYSIRLMLRESATDSSAR